MSLFPDHGPITLRQSPTDFIHAHCDGGSRGNPGPSGFGAVVTDAAGNTLAELSDFLGIRTNNYAEYSGLLAVLDWALQNNYPCVKLVSDSELMVKQIQGKYKVNSPDLKPLWQEARNRIAKLDRFEITHALRHKNKEADALANKAMDRGTRRTAPLPAVAAIPATQSTAPKPRTAPPQQTALPAAALPAMLRGFVKDGSIQILGGHALPDGIFVKIIRE